MRVLPCLLLLCSLSGSRSSGQRYAERSPLPADTLPIVDEYDYDATDGYDFKEDVDIYRWNLRDYPHPRDNPRYCNRMKASHVCDPDNVLDKEQADSLESLIRALYQETPCICDDCQKGDGGIVIGVALLKTLFQPYNEHPSKIIHRLSYTDVGLKTSSYVSVHDAHRIFLENKAHLTANHFYEGLRAMLLDYRAATRNMKRAAATPPLNVSLISGAIVGAVVVLGILVFVAFVVYRRCWNREGKKKQPDEVDHSGGVPSSWTKQDIKVLFSSLKATPSEPATLDTKYQLCESEDRGGSRPAFVRRSWQDEDELIDVTLAIPENNDETRLTMLSAADESPADAMEKELDAAAQDIAKTFPAMMPQQSRPYNGHMTDL